MLGDRRPRRTVALLVVGIVLLIGAGRLIVMGASGIAASLGCDEFLIGATVVAIGTSVPERATTVIAKIRGHDEVSLGTILGSNIFNGLLIVPLVATIDPIPVDWREVGVALLAGPVAIVLAYPRPDGFITRRRGVLLLLLFAVYLATAIQLHSTSTCGKSPLKSSVSTSRS